LVCISDLSLLKADALRCEMADLGIQTRDLVCPKVSVLPSTTPPVRRKYKTMIKVCYLVVVYNWSTFMPITFSLALYCLDTHTINYAQINTTHFHDY